MSRVRIQNIGPIKDVTLDLNKVNVIMGPQSSGKSTIAKVISYCQWVEKRMILDGDFTEDFAERFKVFHRINDTYFADDSLIEYESDAIRIVYTGLNHKAQIEKKGQGESYLNSKNIYIPAERNFVSVIPNLGKYKGSNDNIMNFLYDWYEVKKKYTGQNVYSLLDLQASFYHTQKSDIDTIRLNESGKELPLSSASSGLQSVTPLLLLVDYLTKGLYDEDLLESASEREEMNQFINQLLGSNSKKKEASHEISLDELRKHILSIGRRFKYHFSQMIIEEPEQNLFPKTQRDLVYYLLQEVNDGKRDHKLLLTTHSPFVLYALNNCMMGYLVKGTMPEEEQDELKSKPAWIDPALVSVWEIEEGKGTVRSIKSCQIGTISKHYFNGVMNEVMDEYYEMLNYLEV